MTVINQSDPAMILRNARGEIAHWIRRRMPGVEWSESVDGLLSGLLAQIDRATPSRGGLNPFTVVMDWSSEWQARKEEGEARDEAVSFHVWAEHSEDASDLAEGMRQEYYGPNAEYLRHVIIQLGHNSPI